MKTTRCRPWWWGTGLILALAAMTGCQTWTSGMTLPSPHYLQHPPQFFGPGPAYPLTHELAHMEEGAGPGQPVPGPAPLPPPVPAGPVQ